MKTLRCLNCKTFIVVMDNSVGYCIKCNMIMQEDMYLNRDLGLEKDAPIKRKYISRNKPKKIIKKRNKKKK